MNEFQIFLEFIRKYWVILISIIGWAVILFGIYKEMPLIKKGLKKLERWIKKLDDRVEVIEKKPHCQDHDACFMDLKDDVKNLDQKICKNINEVKAELGEIKKEAKEDRKDLGAKFELIHHSLGRLEGKENNVS